MEKEAKQDVSSPPLSPLKRTMNTVGSPSLGKNKFIKEEGMKRFSAVYQKLDDVSSNNKIITSISDLSVDNMNLNLNLKIHHKFHPNKNLTVAKLLGFDCNGDSINIVFYQKTMKLFQELSEGQYIKITWGKVKESRREYSLASSNFEIDPNNMSNITIIEGMSIVLYTLLTYCTKGNVKITFCYL